MKKGQKNRFSKPVFNGGCGLDTGFMGFIESGLNRDKAIEIGKKNKKSKRKKR